MFFISDPAVSIVGTYGYNLGKSRLKLDLQSGTQRGKRNWLWKRLNKILIIHPLSLSPRH